MSCPSPHELARVIDGDAEPALRAEVLDHAAGCVECHAAIAVAMATSVESTVDARATTAAEVAAPLTLDQPATIDRYQVQRVLGRGAMGVVYAVRDPALDREIAVKVVRPRASDARMRREAQALARLTHPNVVRVYDVGEHAGQTFIAMELVDGQNLRDWLRTPRPLAAVLDVLIQAGRGLIAAHDAGLIHRDFKPDNVLIAASGQVLVGDFGLARGAEGASSDERAAPSMPSTLTSDELTATGAAVGTPAYMAPEQSAGAAEAASDQFAFCVTAWEACFGQRPFAGDSVAALRAAAAAGAIERPAGREVPRRIEVALRRGLAVRPSARFPSMRALVAALEPPPRRRWPRRVAALALAGAAIAVVAVVARDSGRAAPGAGCAQAGAGLAAVWNPAIAAELAETLGREPVGMIDAYAARWRAARIAHCRATHERHEQTVATYERQVACLDGLRDRLAAAVTRLRGGEREGLVPAALIEALATPERCARASAPAAVPAERAAAVALLDGELAAVEQTLAGQTPKLSLAEATALRLRAEAVGHPPLTLRALTAEARIAAWYGDREAAIARLRQVVLAAEVGGDDHARAAACAALATELAESDRREAAGLAQIAEAALARAGGDPAVAQAIASAQVAIAEAGEDYAGAAVAQQRVIELVRAQFGETDAAGLGFAFSKLAALYTLADDRSAANAAREQEARLIGTFADRSADQQILLADSTPLFMAGHFAAARALSQQQLAAARRLDAPPKLTASLLATLAFIDDLDGRLADAFDGYAAAEREWSRPHADFTAGGMSLDLAAIARGRFEAATGQATVLLERGRPDAALAMVRHAEEIAESAAPGQIPRRQLEDLTRTLGVALAASGDLAGARTVLEPIVQRMPERADLKPYTRGRTRFALARVLWEQGGATDRARALALADDADRDLDAAVADGEAMPVLRRLPALARAEQARVRAWRTARAPR